MLDFLVNMLEDARAQRIGRDGQLHALLRFAVTRDEVEDIRHIVGDLRVAGEEGQVGIDLGRDRVIVARAKVAIGPELAILAAHHHRHLGVGLEFDEAEHDLHAGALQIARPADVCFLVETRFELDQRGDGFTCFRGIDQRANDRAVVRGAVKRLLDGEYFGIARSLQEELHHHVEAFIGMVNHHVLFADSSEAIAGMFTNSLRETGIVGLEFQVVARGAHDFRDSVEREKTGQNRDAIIRHTEFMHHELPQRLRHFTVGLDADDGTAAAAFQRAFKEAHQIFGLFLHLDIAIADDAERAGTANGIAGIEPVNEQTDHILERDVADGVLFIRQPHEAVERRRQAQKRRHRLAAVDAVQLQAHGKAEIGNEGERVRRIDGERRQHREHAFLKLGFQPVAILIRKRSRAYDVDFFLGKILLQNGKRGLLLHLQVVDFLQNIFELFCRGLAVRGPDGDLLAHLAFETGDANHEELIEIGRRDGQETQPLQQRVIGVQRFLKDTAVELEPGEFAVDETRGAIPEVLALGLRLNLVEIFLRDSVHALFHPLTNFQSVILLHPAIVLLARITV